MLDSLRLESLGGKCDGIRTGVHTVEVKRAMLVGGRLAGLTRSDKDGRDRRVRNDQARRILNRAGNGAGRKLGPGEAGAADAEQRERGNPTKSPGIVNNRPKHRVAPSGNRSLSETARHNRVKLSPQLEPEHGELFRHTLKRNVHNSSQSLIGQQYNPRPIPLSI